MNYTYSSLFHNGKASSQSSIYYKLPATITTATAATLKHNYKNSHYYHANSNNSGQQAAQAATTPPNTTTAGANTPNGGNNYQHYQPQYQYQQMNGSTFSPYLDKTPVKTLTPPPSTTPADAAAQTYVRFVPLNGQNDKLNTSVNNVANKALLNSNYNGSTVSINSSCSQQNRFSLYNYEFTPIEKSPVAGLLNRKNSFNQLNNNDGYSRKYVTLSNGSAMTAMAGHNGNLKYITSSFGSLTSKNFPSLYQPNNPTGNQPHYNDHQPAQQPHYSTTKQNNQPQQQPVGYYSTPTTNNHRKAPTTYATANNNKSNNNYNAGFFNGSNLAKLKTASSTSSDAESFLLTDLEYESHNNHHHHHHNHSQQHSHSQTPAQQNHYQCQFQTLSPLPSKKVDKSGKESKSTNPAANNNKYTFKNMNNKDANNNNANNCYETYDSHGANAKSKMSVANVDPPPLPPPAPGSAILAPPQKSKSSNLYNKLENKAKNLKDLDSENLDNLYNYKTATNNMKMVSNISTATTATTNATSPANANSNPSEMLFSSVRYSKSPYFNSAACSSSESLNKLIDEPGDSNKLLNTSMDMNSPGDGYGGDMTDSKLNVNSSNVFNAYATGSTRSVSCVDDQVKKYFTLNPAMNTSCHYSPSKPTGNTPVPTNNTTATTNATTNLLTSNCKSLYYDSGIGADVSQVTSSNTANDPASLNKLKVLSNLKSMKSYFTTSTAHTGFDPSSAYYPNPPNSNHHHHKKPVNMSGTLNENILRKLNTSCMLNAANPTKKANDAKNNSQIVSLSQSISSSSSASSSSSTSSCSSPVSASSTSTTSSSTSAQISSFSNGSVSKHINQTTNNHHHHHNNHHHQQQQQQYYPQNYHQSHHQPHARKRLDSIFHIPDMKKSNKFNSINRINDAGTYKLLQQQHQQQTNNCGSLLTIKNLGLDATKHDGADLISSRMSCALLSTKSESKSLINEMNEISSTSSCNNNNNASSKHGSSKLKSSLNINLNNLKNTSSNFNKADFTPKIMKNGALKNSHSIIRKYHVPPPPLSQLDMIQSSLSQDLVLSNNKKATSQHKSASNASGNQPSQENYTSKKASNPNSTDTYYISPLLYGRENSKESKTAKSAKSSETTTSTATTASSQSNGKQPNSMSKVPSSNVIAVSQNSSPINGNKTSPAAVATTATSTSLPSTNTNTSNNNNASVTNPNSLANSSTQLYTEKKVPKCEKKCVALNDYIALYSKNLSLKKGEKYTLLNKENESWYLIKDKQGNSGFAPATYLEFIDDNFKDPINKLDKSHYGKDWFHGNLSRSEAYTLLVTNQSLNGTFLLRNNSSEKGKYTLCVYKNGKVYNYKVNVHELKYFIDTKNKFNNLADLVDFYQKNSAGLVCILKIAAEKQFIDKKSLLDILDTNYKRFIIERNDLEFHEKIGSGQFGIVLKAEYKQRKVVAIKKMKPGSKEDEMNFNREAEFMIKLQSLQEFQHRNLMQFYGLCKDFDESILIVTEFVKYGSLYNYLIKHKERIINSKSRFLRLLNICMDVCDGMEYLESKHIIHRDLATRNCLVGEGEVIKVADFGLARFTEDCYIAHPQSQFPVKWSAPEVIKYRSYSTKSDVWSFSCLMYEVFTLGKMPYGGSTTNSIAAKHIVSGVIPERPSYCPINLYETIMIKSWNKEPKDRPSFKDLLKLLGNFT